jgi:hypothetical protein
MKILTFKRIIGLAAVGGVAYVHKQRGGEWTFASLKDTLSHLWTEAGRKLAPLKREARDTLERAAHATESAASRNRPASGDDRLSRSYSDYIKRKDDAGPH